MPAIVKMLVAARPARRPEAAITPRGTPTRSASAIEAIVSSSVTGIRSRSSWVSGSRLM